MEKLNHSNIRLAYLVNQPIQYQAPLLRHLTNESGFNLKVFYRSDFSVKEFMDPDFKIGIQWDIELLGGYDYEILPALGSTDRISFWLPWNFGLSKRLRTENVRVLWLHGYTSFFNLYAVGVAKLLGIKVLLRDEATVISKERSIFNKFAKRIVFYILNLLCDAFLSIGTLNKEYYLANGIPEEKIFETPYAVDNHFFQGRAKLCDRDVLRTSLKLTSGRPIILFAGKLITRKGPDELLDAFRYVITELPSRPYLIFAGDGELRSQLERKATELDLEGDVIFTGFIKQSDLPCFYDLCDLFVLPSLFEPWGLVINEVMNAGRAVIASNQVGSSLDLIHSGQNGFIYKAGDSEDLASAIIKILSNPSQCRLMGQESLRFISKWGFDEDANGLKQAIDFVFSGDNLQPGS